MAFLPIEVARVFSSTKKVESPLLNTLGVQVARTVSAHALYRVKPWHHDASWEKHVHALREDGMVAIENFLPDDVFSRLREQTFAWMNDPAATRRLHQHGRTSVEQFDILSAPEDKYPELHRYLDNPTLHVLMEAGEKRRIDFHSGCRVAERVSFSDSTEHDQENDLHMDIFFHTHKAWLYLNPVTLEDGPLTFVKGSHKISLERLKLEYQESLKSNTKGSRRITEEEMRQRGLHETVLTCNANTLVVANTCGYHRRSHGLAGHQRFALHVSARYNPFLPSFLPDETQIASLPWVRQTLSTLGYNKKRSS